MLPVQPTSALTEVLAFWRDAGPARWFRKDDAFDAEFRRRFLGLHEVAARRDLDAWAATPDGALALCILLDQFPRNAFRGTPRMFANDAKARTIVQVALESGFDEIVDDDLRAFFYMPLMHSEDLQDQELCVELTQGLASDTHRYAVMHRDIIQRFGRFPHRNAILGRGTTNEEAQFLAGGGFAG
jgi:uncharacterized protein (DUF924 family)